MSQKKIKILIVEDESIVGADLKDTLLKLDYTVIDVVRTGEDAITKAFNTKPDLILMDIMLDGNISGIDAAQKIKEKIDVPIIYLTAYADEGTIQNAKLTDPFAYILKPFEERTLFFSIENAIYKHEANLKLKKSEERYRTLVELSPISICIAIEGKIVYANQALLKLLGIKDLNGLIEKPIEHLVVSEFQNFLSEKLRSVEDHGEAIRAVEIKVPSANGVQIEAEISAIQTEYEGKSAVQIVFRDISEEKRKEKIQQTTIKILQSINFSKSLSQEYEYLYKTLIDFIPIKNVAFTTIDEKTKKIVFQFYMDQFNAFDFAHKLDEILIEQTIRSARKQILDISEISEIVKLHADLSKIKIPLRWIGVPLPINDNSTLVLIIKEYDESKMLVQNDLEMLNAIIVPLCRAIERKMIEQDLKVSLEKLAELNQTKDNFFSLISHDLRSPFDSIIGFTEVLKNDLESLSQEEIKLYLDSLYQTSRHIYTLINNLLQYSKFQLGNSEFSPKGLKLREIVEKNVEILKGISIKKEISIRFHEVADLCIKADEDMVNSIVLNLLTNAIKFTPRKGEILVSAGKMNGFVQVHIKDSGVGMDQAKIAKIFKLDAKKSTPGTENESGTGLGLLLVKQFIERHSGTIEVESKPNMGTTFSFTIPCCP
ncbi:MAG: response regulator [Ignavibacteriaceae bacterium]|nr:response regulator [Ignavibacteriaceae bacterium]